MYVELYFRFLILIQGTGKTYTGTKLVYIFDRINSRLQTEGHAKKQLVFCGPNNKSVDLVASKFFDIRYRLSNIIGDLLQSYSISLLLNKM